jgi:hypothetical protein
LKPIESKSEEPPALSESAPLSANPDLSDPDDDGPFRVVPRLVRER